MHYNAHGFKSDKRPPISKGASRHGHCCSVGCLQPISSWPSRMRWGQRTLHQHLDSQWQCSDTPCVVCDLLSSLVHDKVSSVMSNFDIKQIVSQRLGENY